MTTETKAGDPHILFELLGATYAVPSATVRHIEMVETVTPMPNAAPYVEGVVLSRGEIIPAINLRVRFRFDKAPFDLRTRLIVVQAGARVVGLIVDSAHSFVSISRASIQPPPESVIGDSAKYLTGVATLNNRLVLVLDVEKLLAAEEGHILAHANGTELK